MSLFLSQRERKGLSAIVTTYPGWYGGLLSVSHGLVTTNKQTNLHSVYTGMAPFPSAQPAATVATHHVMEDRKRQLLDSASYKVYYR